MTLEDQVLSRVAVHNNCCLANVESSFTPLLPVAVRAYQDVFGDTLASVRLMGSVARGDAVAGRSDIDFLALVDRLVSDDVVSRQLAEHAARLHRSYPVVSAVDLDAVESTALSAFQRFALSSDSFILYGRDELCAPAQALDRDTLVALVTPDPAPLIAAWRQTIADLAPGIDDETVRRRTRTMSKDLLRCLRGIALRQGAAYEPGVHRIHEQVVRHLPHCRILADNLLQAYRQPITGQSAAMELIDDAERILVPT